MLRQGFGVRGAGGEQAGVVAARLHDGALHAESLDLHRECLAHGVQCGLARAVVADGGHAAAAAQPLDEAKEKRLRSAQKAGQLDPQADLDLVLELLYAPLFQRWLHRSGPLTPAYGDSLVDATLRAFSP
ncbi:TetR-like C-terminal domain-containing protein [Streptomyces thinghirensis]|uniref:TetR-like C-terminal domain-containing protein n=1 Tax=Streptomyces thinghirensis TaxID=551547 RepID=UPI0031EA9D91